MPYFFYLWVEDGFIRNNPTQRQTTPTHCQDSSLPYADLSIEDEG